MKVHCDAEAAIPFDLHLARENRVARECARRVTPCPPTVRAPCVDDGSRGTPGTVARSPSARPQSREPRATRPDAPRLAEVAPVPVRLKVERVETVYRVRQFMPRGSMVDVVV